MAISVLSVWKVDKLEQHHEVLSLRFNIASPNPENNNCDVICLYKDEKKKFWIIFLKASKSKVNSAG